MGATVVPSAHLTVAWQPHQLILKPEDVARGYAEVVPAMSLIIRTNSREGYFLDFQLASKMIWGADVMGLARDAFVTPDFGRVSRRTEGPVRERLDVGFRFHLTADALPGVYSWPMSVSAAAR